MSANLTAKGAPPGGGFFTKTLKLEVEMSLKEYKPGQAFPGVIGRTWIGYIKGGPGRLKGGQNEEGFHSFIHIRTFALLLSGIAGDTWDAFCRA